MNKSDLTKLSEIHNVAKQMLSDVRQEKDRNIIVDRIVILIDKYNSLLDTLSDLPISKIERLDAWKSGDGGHGKYAHSIEVKNALSEIIGAIDSLPELKADKSVQSSELIKILNLGKSGLRKVIRNLPEKEKEIQEGFEYLLIGANIPYSRETDSIEYSSKTYIPDFTFTEISLALEMKFCNNASREKTLIAEINDDILAYSTKYKNILFFIYDTGHIRDIDRFASSFTQSGVYIEIVKH